MRRLLNHLTFPAALLLAFCVSCTIRQQAASPAEISVPSAADISVSSVEPIAEPDVPPAIHSRGRWFESSHSDQSKNRRNRL